MALDVRLYIILVILCDISLQRRFYYKLDGRQNMDEVPSLRNKNVTRVVIHVEGWRVITTISVNTSDEEPTVFIRHFDGSGEKKFPCDFDEDYMEYKCNRLARYAVVESKSILRKVGLVTKNFLIDEYIGCFKNYSTSQIRNTGAVGVCNDFCETFYGISSKRVCICAQSLNELIQVDLSLCDKYDNDYGLSGRDDYFAIFLKGLKHIGYSNSSWDCIYELNDCPKCPKGKMGISCEIIDCSIDNGNCGDSKCQIISLPPLFTFKNCFCTSGFHVGPTQCEDIDECANTSNTCDAGTTQCVNIVGSYMCKCLPGFKKLNEFECEALQEHEKDQEKEQEREQGKDQEKEKEKETDQEKDPKAEMNLVYTGAGFAAVALLCIIILYIYFKKKSATKA